MKKFISIIILATFISTSVKSPGYAQSDQQGMMPFLPVPGVMVHLSPEFTSAHLQGITIHPDNALQFDFLINKGDQDLEGDQKTGEYKKLVKYFLASLTIPDEDQWVNLSPYEKDRIIKDDFGKTEMGRDLLAEDYLLKQITSSLIYPEDGLGKKFWDKVYERAWNEYHTTEIPVNTFNKVWIVPDQAYIYESGNSAYILKSHLKVMLEEDYLSFEKHNGIITAHSSNNTHAIGSQVIREIILPELEKEVNEGKNFANLRQMYSGMILATWYKKVLRESLLGKVYADKAKVKGVDQDPKTNEKIYQRYLQAFKKGVFNYIKEDVDKYTNEAIPRKYFSGGFVREKGDTYINSQDLAMMGPDEKGSIDAALMSEGSEEDVVKVNFLGTQGAGVEQNGSGEKAVRTPEDLWSIARRAVNFFNLKYSRDKKLPYFYLSGNKEKIVTTWMIENHFPALPIDEMQTVRDFAGQLVGNIDGADLLLAALGNLLPAAGAIPDKAMAAGKRTAIVADDDSAVLIINKMVLELQGFNVLTAASPGELEEVMAKHGEEVSLLVTDTTGWTDTVANVLSKVKREIPILAVSGADSEDVWKKANVPITAFLKKPYGIKQLRDVVNTILPQDSAMAAEIVVVSSDLNLRRMIESDLGTPGVNVLAVASPSALQQAMKGKVSLLVIDARTAWVSPGMAANNTPALVLGLGLDDMNVWKKKNTAIFNLPYSGKEFLGRVHEILSNDQAMTAEERAFYDNRTEMNYRKVLVNRIKHILYKQDLLIVGDSPFSTMLKLRGGFYGIEVMTAAHGIEAANILLKEPTRFKAIILDIDEPLGQKRLASLMRIIPGLSKIPMVLTGDYDFHKDFFATLNNKNMRLVEKAELPVFSALADLVEDQQDAAMMASEPERAGEDTMIDRALSYWLHNADSPVGRMPPEFVLDFRAVLRGEKSIDDVVESESYGDKRMIKRVLVAGWLGTKYGLQIGQEGLYGFLSQRDGYKEWQESRTYLIREYLPRFTNFPAQKIVEEAENMMDDAAMNVFDKGGIDFNAANLNLQIKRDGRGVPLPLAQQDMDQLMQIQGFVPVIIEIKPAFNVPIISELQQKLQPAST